MLPPLVDGMAPRLLRAQTKCYSRLLSTDVVRGSRGCWTASLCMLACHPRSAIRARAASPAGPRSPASYVPPARVWSSTQATVLLTKRSRTHTLSSPSREDARPLEDRTAWLSHLEFAPLAGSTAPIARSNVGAPSRQYIWHA